MNEPDITIVVVPRERFSYAEKSLESVYAHTQIPFKLVYVDGKAPYKLRKYLEEKAQIKGFEIVHTNQYLYPNQARNIGLQQANTKYVVFIDNDVVVTPGWLKALVGCAEETGAAVVGPLMCQHEPLHAEVHFAGGESHIWVDKTGRRRLREKMYSQGKTVTQIQPQLKRQETELAEFHCVLVRRSIFEQVGLLDEQMLNTKEHLDFCMTVREAGGSVYFEPNCVVTYVPGPPSQWSDLHYYMLRWSDEWTLKSLDRLRDKWNLAEDGYFKTKYKKLGWRRKVTIVAPVILKLTFGLYSPKLERVLMWFDHRLNRLLTARHARQQQRYQLEHTSLSKSPTSI